MTNVQPTTDRLVRALQDRAAELRQQLEQHEAAARRVRAELARVAPLLAAAEAGVGS